MPTFIPDHVYHRLVDDLMQGFIRAATSHLTDMRNETINALAAAGVMPERARGDFEPFAELEAVLAGRAAITA